MKRNHLISVNVIIGILIPITSMADIWQDPVSKVLYNYSTESNTASVAGGKSGYYIQPEGGQPDAKGNITILSRISPGDGSRTYTVTSILGYAFYENNGVSSVTIPETIKTICGSAFARCSSLTNVIISEGLDSIGKDAFDHCRALEHIDLPSSLRGIGMGAFASTGLKEVVLPQKLQIIDEAVFWNSDLEQIAIGENVKTIKRGAFASTKLKSIHIPASVTSIEFSEQLYPGQYEHYNTWLPGAFQECQRTLESITVDSANPVFDSRGNTLVHTSENKIYLGCSFSTIVSSVVGWTNYAFDYCDQLEHLVIPSHIESVISFNQCANLKTVRLGSGTKYLNAFVGCPNLEEIYLDKPVRCVPQFDHVKVYIPDESFIYDVNRYTIYKKDTIWGLHENFRYSNIWVDNPIAHYELTNLNIPEGIKELKRCTVGGANLKTVSIPQSLSISSAFISNSLTNLERIKISNLASWLNVDWENDTQGNPLTYCPHLFLNDKEIVDTLVVPEGITVLKKYAIPISLVNSKWKSWVKVLDIPMSLKSIKASAVKGEFDKIILHDLAAWFNVDMQETTTYTDSYGKT